MVSFSDLLRLNQYAQGVRPMREAQEWFSGLDSEEKTIYLRQLVALVQQAHPMSSDVSEAITRSGLKATHTPSILMSRGPFTVQAAKVVTLPSYEQERAFVLFLALLGIADARRRNEECGNGCSHWWHRNLASEEVVRDIIRLET